MENKSHVATITPAVYRRLARNSELFFYSAAAGVNLLFLFIGFSPFFLHDQGESGRIIHPGMVIFDVVHGMSMLAWYVLSLVQALLVSSNNRRLHTKLGWVSVALIPLVAISSVIIALRSVGAMPSLIFFQIPYPHFLLLMLTQVSVFLVCSISGVLLRKRPNVHRVLMLTSSLSLLLGATARIPWLNDIFSGYIPVGYFGPVFAWCAVLTTLGSIRLGKFDRRLAAGYVLIVIANLTAYAVAGSSFWEHWATALVS
ncbi:MAG: hypothetical protein LBQ20_06590 [Rhodanobacter sp.]|jgi:hypothetical protein|nr:hypothetical protein [Rhodanobacter sp.]